MRDGARVEGWTLLAKLGAGGNATVWRARREDGIVAAVKFLHPNKSRPNSEAYRRFRDEIRLLADLGSRPGILPLIDASLPSVPTDRNPAWLAMPEAVGIRQALGDQPLLDTVVKAVATVAETLASLADERIHHRDIKPSNLYRRDGEWVIGDFGLAEFPDKEALTRKGQRLGPANFMAPEMISNPESADAGPADVYSLAKTLWVLANGKLWPYQGELRLDRALLRLSSYIPDHRAHLLDPLLEHATRDDPQTRPSMAKLAADLRVWLADPVASIALATVGDLAGRIHQIQAAALEEDDAYQGHIAAATRALDQLRDQLLPIDSELQKVIPRWGTCDGSNVVFEELDLGQSPALYRAGWASMRWAQASGPVGPVDMGFWAAVGVEVLSEGRLGLIAAYAIQEQQRGFDIAWSSAFTEVPDTAAAQSAIASLGVGLAENLRPALQQFVNWLEVPYRHPQARSHLAATTGIDGRIYVLGGQLDSEGAVGTAEAYDPPTRSWELLPPLRTPRLMLSAACGEDGRIYTVGGEGGGAMFNTVEAYTPSVRTWETVAPLSSPRADAGLVSSLDGRLIVVGGLSPNYVFSRAVEAYEPRVDRWSVLTPLPGPRHGAGVAVGSDGRIYAIGGMVAPSDRDPTSLMEVYDPVHDQWESAPPMPTARSWLVAVRGGRGQIYAVGGYNQALGGSLATVEVYDPETEMWTPRAPLKFPRCNFAAAVGFDGQIYVIGGPLREIKAHDTFEVLVP